MHKYYDPRLFHVMDRDEILTEYAPKQREGVLLSETEVSNLSDGEKLKAAKSVVDTPQLFIAAGFDVNFVGPDADPTECGVCGQDSPPMDEELGAPSSEKMFVDEDTFCVWMDSAESVSYTHLRAHET